MSSKKTIGIEEHGQLLYSLTRERIDTLLSSGGKAVLTLSGCSGCGKTSAAEAWKKLLQFHGLSTLVIGGDDFPHRIPAHNDAERLRLFRTEGLKALAAAGLYSDPVMNDLTRLRESGQDADRELCSAFPWLETYREAGSRALREYLGTPLEIDFDLLNRTLNAFRSGAPKLLLKQLGREPDALRFQELDVSAVQVLILEWTHGCSPFLTGADLRVMLYATPEMTLERRLIRNRDAGADSPFTALVLSLEQEKLDAQRPDADLVLDLYGSVLKPLEVNA